MRWWLVGVCAASLACGGGGTKGGGNPPPPPGTTTLNLGTFLGGNDADIVRDVVYDSNNNLIVVGGTVSTNFPTRGGSVDSSFNGSEDAFVVKFDSAGAVVWASYLGGAQLDRAYAVEVDSSNNVVVAGRAGASFPVTAGVVQGAADFKGSAPTSVYPDPQDGFVAKLNGATGALMWATFFGADDDSSSIIRDIAVDRSNDFIYLAASTNNGGTYPAAILNALQAGEYSSQFGAIDVVLAKLSSNGQSLAWATYVGGNLHDDPTPSVRIDAQGNPIVLTGTASTNAPTRVGNYQRVYAGGLRDFYIAKFDVNGQEAGATYLGGSGIELVETHNLWVRANGDVVVAGGYTAGGATNFPVTNGAYDTSHNGNGGSGTGQNTNYPGDCVVAVLNSNLTSLIAATFLGGQVGEACEGVSADANNNIYVAGGTFSPNMPTTSGAYQTTRNSTISAFAAVFNRDLTALRYATYIGGTGDSIARTAIVRAEGRFTIGGQGGTGWPIQNPFGGAVSAGDSHGVIADLTVPLGPG
jgi:hypothetical protein